MALALSEEPEFYLLQRGDELEIKVFNLPELDTDVTVRPDGRISVLLLDDVYAAGLTTEELDAILTQRYAEFFQAPEVTIIVRTFTNLEVYVGGEVSRPGMVPLRGVMSMARAIFQAGGFRDTAKVGNVILLRNVGKPEPLIERVNMKEILKEGAPDVVLRPFDVIYVPKTAIARMDQFVSQYIRQLLPVSTNANFTYIWGDRTVNLD